MQVWFAIGYFVENWPSVHNKDIHVQFLFGKVVRRRVIVAGWKHDRTSKNTF